MPSAPGIWSGAGSTGPYGKPWYHLRVSQIDSAVPREVIGWMAGDVAVHGTKIVDSTGFSISRYRDWHNAKYRTISGEAVCKTARRARPRGHDMRRDGTPGRANDSSYLWEMLARMPRGSGDMPADAQYCRVENCQDARDGGRRPVTAPRSDYTIEGKDVRAETLGFSGERPGGVCARTFQNCLKRGPRAPLGLGAGRSWWISAAVLCRKVR